MSGTAGLKRLLELNAEKDRLEARIKEITAERDEITNGVLEQWSMDGVTQMRVDGATVYVRRSAYARILDRDRVKEVMEGAGLAGMLTPNTNTLSAWIREREADGQPLPESFEGVVGVFERFALGVRNGAACL